MFCKVVAVLHTSEFADLMLGYYGTTLGEKDPDVVSKAATRQNKTAITCRPADLLEPASRTNAEPRPWRWAATAATKMR